MIDKFFKVTYIKNKKKLPESDLYIESEGVLNFKFKFFIINNKK